MIMGAQRGFGNVMVSVMRPRRLYVLRSSGRGPNWYLFAGVHSGRLLV